MNKIVYLIMKYEDDSLIEYGHLDVMEATLDHNVAITLFKNYELTYPDQVIYIKPMVLRKPGDNLTLI